MLPGPVTFIGMFDLTGSANAVAQQPALSTLSTSKLILLVRSGSLSRPWAEIDRRFRDRAVRVARATLSSGGQAACAAADEVAPDALSTAYLKLRLYDGLRPFWPWLSRLVRNYSLDWLRQQRLRWCAGLGAVG